ncbi:MAG: serine hydroxymethyltransferase [Bifidobacterium aquikefiri]|uniref:Serine hydroxymethyltransferase n=1 Tax=Bifidobacterium aquikefiri TaxID=1653207 RepID=A0A261G1V9_9BIFI|nr:serine hydroxymethyltransferase [Bifidobacterium aquikefiri]OZG65412.1 serine hydroxymethyltransferase [Bifidobacterium aquikefiri]
MVQAVQAQTSTDIFNAPISQSDPEVAEILDSELHRQQRGLEMIASENFVPKAVLQAQGSVLTNKYAEGYPGRRYYGGCEEVDKVETLARERAKELFHAEFANVQPHSGAQANAAVYQTLVKPGDTILGLALSHGGHLTHGMKINFSGRFYHAESYGVNPDTFLIDPEIIRQRALETHPAMIIGGWSAYPRIEDFKAMKEIADEVGAKFWVDMAHFAGLVATGLHPSPIPYADVVSSTAHKTLGGPRAGFILAKKEYAKKINSAVFPGEQGGPLMHVVAAKAVAFKVAGSPAFRNRMERTLEGARILADRLMAKDVADNGITVLTGGTDVHLVMVDLRHSDMDGKQGEDLLAKVGITINRNTVPFDPRPASIASGLRIGTSALATRGFSTAQYEEVADIIGTALAQGSSADVDTLKARVDKLVDDFPLYPGLDQID